MSYAAIDFSRLPPPDVVEMPDAEALVQSIKADVLARAPELTAVLALESDPVLAAIVGLEVPNLTGGTATILPNHHLTKPVLIGEIRADGQFDIVSQTDPVPGDAWTDFLPESAVLEADWPGRQCGMWNTQTETCVQVQSNY